MSDDDNIVTFPGNQKDGPEECETCGAHYDKDGYQVDEMGHALVYTCMNCECRSFRLLSNGTIECCNCEEVLNLGDAPDDKAKEGWRKSIPDLPDDISSVPDIGPNNTNIRAMGEADFSQHLTMKDIKAWAKDNTLVFVGAYRDDGRGVWWMGAHDSGGRDWMVDKIEGIAHHMKTTKYPTDTEPELDLGAVENND